MGERRLSQPSFAFLLNAPALLAIVLLVGYSIIYSAWLVRLSNQLVRDSVRRTDPPVTPERHLIPKLTSTVLTRHGV